MLPTKADKAPTGRPKKTSSVAAAADALVAAAAFKDGAAKNRPESWSPASFSDAKAVSASFSVQGASSTAKASGSNASSSKSITEAPRVDVARPATVHPDSRVAGAHTAVQSLTDSGSKISSKSGSPVPAAANPSTSSSPPAAASSFLSSVTPSIFADEAFDMDAFLLRAASSNSDIHSLSPANLRAFLLALLERVTGMEAQARDDLQINESSYAEVENIRTSEVEACENELEEMLERLRVLTSSVANIWGKSRGTADALITADRQRTRAVEAVEIIEWFERIKEERLPTVHKEIVNPTACWGYAHLVHGLAAFARDLRVSGCATAVADVQQLEELFERCRTCRR
jgi:hypothetical protein